MSEKSVLDGLPLSVREKIIEQSFRDEIERDVLISQNDLREIAACIKVFCSCIDIPTPSMSDSILNHIYDLLTAVKIAQYPEKRDAIIKEYEDKKIKSNKENKEFIEKNIPKIMMKYGIAVRKKLRNDKRADA